MAQVYVRRGLSSWDHSARESLEWPRPEDAWGHHRPAPLDQRASLEGLLSNIWPPSLTINLQGFLLKKSEKASSSSNRKIKA